MVPEPQKADLLHTVRTELDKVQQTRAALEKRRLPVYVLKRAAEKPVLSPAAGAGKGVVFAGFTFRNQGVDLKQFAYFLANALIGYKPWLPLPVVDENGLEGYYNLDFAFQFEGPASLSRELVRLGLVLEKAERVTECLVVTQNKR